MSFIPVNRPLLIGNEKKYVLEALDSGWISSDGPFVEEFENKFSKKFNRKFGIAVANGTAALEISAKALGIRAGQEVIMPTFTIISCALAVIRCGAKPIFVDCYPNTWNLNIEEIESKITSKTTAILMPKVALILTKFLTEVILMEILDCLVNFNRFRQPSPWG